MADIVDARPMRGCAAWNCDKVDDAPRDKVGKPDGTEDVWHMDCHYLMEGCKVCWAVLQTAGGHTEKGLKDDDLVNHLTDPDVHAKHSIFTHENAVEHAAELHAAAKDGDK